MAIAKPKSIPDPSMPNSEPNSHDSTEVPGNEAPAKMKLFDLPVELVLNIADFLHQGNQACLAITCRRAKDIFKGRMKQLSRSERQRFLHILQKESPTKIICQHHLQLVKSCHDPKMDPSNRSTIGKLMSAFHFPAKRCKISNCVPIPSIRSPKFILSYEHIQRVMLRHRLGLDFGNSLDCLSHSSQIPCDAPFQEVTCDMALDFRIHNDQLYVLGKYDFKGADVMHFLTFTRDHFDICPHLYLDHNRRPYAGEHRVPVRLPGLVCRVLDEFCFCQVARTFDPGWRRHAPNNDKENNKRSDCSYVTVPTRCRQCPTDFKMRFDVAPTPQELSVEFWRCLGTGLTEDEDLAWQMGALDRRNQSGDEIVRLPGVFRWLRGADLVWGTTQRDA